MVLNDISRNSTIITEKTIKIKAIAGEKINSIFPEWKQRNIIARSTELTEKKADGIALTQPELDELIIIKALWSRVKAIRVASDAIEADLTASVDPLSFNIETSINWPE